MGGIHINSGLARDFMPIALVLLLAVAGLNSYSTYMAQVAMESLEEDLASAEQTILALQEENRILEEKLIQVQEGYEGELTELGAELERVTRLNEVLQQRDAYSSEQVIYLTFDDGPSANVTGKILDILDYYEIKATFFVIGARCLTQPELIKRIHASGHAIGNHTYNHDHKNIYRNIDTFTSDFHATQEAIHSIIGEYPRLYRYAGGSLTSRNHAGRTSQAQFNQYLWQQGMQYFDWNIDSGDARGGTTVTVDSIIGNTINQLRNRQKAIVLMHDFKYRQSTVEALPTIIETLLERGYKFESLSPTGYTVHHSN